MGRLDSFSNNFGNDEQIFIYIEKYQKSNGCVLFDFLDSNEFNLFNGLTNVNYNWAEKPTMVELLNFNQKRVQEGVYYSVKFSSFRDIVEQIEIVEDSFLIGFRISLKNDTRFEIGESVSFNESEIFFRNMQFRSDEDLDGVKLNHRSIDQIVVRCIGQGNWNEVISNGLTFLVFDFGTIYTTKREQLLSLIGARDSVYQNSKPVFILSHWDVDHYHFLLGFQDETIKSVRKFICRTAVPNVTARKAIGRFEALNPGAVVIVSPISPSPKRSSTKLYCSSLNSNNTILFFNAAKNRSRNKSGIGLAIRNAETSVVLAGDYDYEQISKYILPHLSYPCDHYLVVPHHGGKAGKFVYNSASYIRLKDAIISVGNNPYNPRHPHDNNIVSLTGKGFKVKRSDIMAVDYIINV